MADLELPAPPSFEPELLARCEADGNFRPLLFEWYKYSAILCHIAASIMRDSPGIREMPHVHFAVLTGMLHRISRLMLANLALTSQAKFGETTRILDRCMTETALKVQWLCIDLDTERFRRFLSDGLKQDLKLRDHLAENIQARDGTVLVIERRMLESITRMIRASQLTDAEILATKKLPDMWSLIEDLGLDEGAYIALQRMGSHPIHGSWTDLLTHYLDEESDGSFLLCTHRTETHENQFIVVPLTVLQAVRSFLAAIAVDGTAVQEFSSAVDVASREIESIGVRTTGTDYDQDPVSAI